MRLNTQRPIEKVPTTPTITYNKEISLAFKPRNAKPLLKENLE